MAQGKNTTMLNVSPQCLMISYRQKCQDRHLFLQRFLDTISSRDHTFVHVVAKSVNNSTAKSRLDTSCCVMGYSSPMSHISSWEMLMAIYMYGVNVENNTTMNVLFRCITVLQWLVPRYFTYWPLVELSWTMLSRHQQINNVERTWMCLVVWVV